MNKQEVINSLKKWALIATGFWVTLFWVVYAANIISVTTQTISTWDSIWAGWYQSVNDKLLNTYTKTEVDTNFSLKNSPIVDNTSTCTSSIAGTLRYNNNILQICNSNAWSTIYKPPLSASGGSVTTYSYNGDTYQVHTFTSNWTFNVTNEWNADEDHDEDVIDEDDEDEQLYIRLELI